MPPQYTDVGSIHLMYPAINTAQNTGLTSDVVRGFIQQVEAEINFKLSKKYILPLSVNAPILNVIATRESIYRIAVERGLLRSSPAGAGKQPLETQHEADQKLLEQIADGTYNLVGGPLDGSSSSVASLGGSLPIIETDLTQSEVFSTTMNANSTFHEGGWLDQVQDTDKLEGELARRVGRGL
jgi:phage gp36-like protein